MTDPTPAAPATAAPAQPGTRPEDVTLTRGDGDPSRTYPQAGAHTWQEFAGLAIEMGGYSDLTACDPYSGDRLHLMYAFGDSHTLGEVSFYDGLRRLVDAMEQAQFMGSPTPDEFAAPATTEPTPGAQA